MSSPRQPSSLPVQKTPLTGRLIMWLGWQEGG